MKRTALIAAALSIVPLAAGTMSAEADPLYRGGGMYPGGYGRHVAPPVPHYGPTWHRPRFDRYPPRHRWHPLPPWRRWHYWR